MNCAPACAGAFVQIDDRGVGTTLWSPIGVFMPGCDPVQPDLLVLRQEDLGMIHDRRIYGIPALLIEVLSPSNPEQDMEVKRDVYARAGVPEYWVVRPAERDLLVYAQPDSRLGIYTPLTISHRGHARVADPAVPHGGRRLLRRCA